MPITIEVAGGITRASVKWAEARLRAALEEMSLRATTARVRFADDNGPKGGVAVRCGLTVKLPRRPPEHVEHVGTTPRLAFDGVLDRFREHLARDREIARVNRRRPTKYFVATKLRTQV